MRQPARGPIGTMGIDGKANAASRRRRGRSDGYGAAEVAQ